MNIGKSLASLGLYGFAALAVYCQVDFCGLGIVVVIGLAIIWNSK